MNKTDILNIISKPVLQMKTIDVQDILKLVTIISAMHLANKVDKIIKEIEDNDNAKAVIDVLK